MAADEVLDHAKDLQEETVALRRDLHRLPELGNELPRTRERVLEALDGLPLDVRLHEQTSGITAMLTGDRPGPTVLLRGDMDALPLHEDTALDFASSVDGAMHACGHDTHTAMLASAARLLSDRRGDLAGRVLFMFQPGEEGHHGARFMLDEGLLDVPPLADGSPSPVQHAFALHITSALPTGFVGCRPGPLMASSDELRITVTGRGGHASEPFRALDPIPIACEIVQAIQTMVTRKVDPFDPTVVTVASIHAGTTTNVIPETAEILGTIRAVSEKTRALVHDALKRVAEGVASAHDAAAEVHVNRGYGVTVNDAADATFSLGLAGEVLGKDHVIPLPHPVMGAEDWSYVLNRVPGTMMFLGGTAPERDLRSAAPNHSNRVVFDEAAMPSGVALYASYALTRLAPA